MATYFCTDEARERAYQLATSKTARRLLDGTQRWSLGDLRGAARTSAGSYARTRDRFLEKLALAGLQPVTLYLRPHNERVVVI
jgi:hypothetical protein